MNSLKAIKDLVQETVDKGITSVETVHREIMNQPYYIIERMVPRDVPVKRIRTMQEQVIGTVYGMIRVVNKTVGDVADGFLAHEKKGHTAPPEYHHLSSAVHQRAPRKRTSHKKKPQARKRTRR